MAAHNRVRRARPALGTIVEISAAAGQDSEILESAIDAAFSVIGEVERLMSFHDPHSELSRVNSAKGAPTQLQPWTFEVLSIAKNLWLESAGVFDVSVAPFLQDGAILPVADKNNDPGRLSFGAVVLSPPGTVTMPAGMVIDLGGIAKGFAVDRALEVLVAHGAESGAVNAGGDIGVFGSEPQVISLRPPLEPRNAVPFITVQNAAVASSGNYFQAGSIVDPVERKRLFDERAVLVLARKCVLADALTKVAYIEGRDAAPLLEKHGAIGWEFTGGASDLQITSLSDKRHTQAISEFK